MRFALPEFASAILTGLARQRREAGEIRFEPTSRMAETQSCRPTPR